MRFKDKGPKHLYDLHMLFDKVHVIGASASCPGDISSGESSDDNIAEVEPDDVKLVALKKSNKEKKKRKRSSTATKEKDDKSPFLRLYKNRCLRIGLQQRRYPQVLKHPQLLLLTMSHPLQRPYGW